MLESTISSSDTVAYIINSLNEELEQAKEENKQLKTQLTLERFRVNRFTNDDTCISFYTGVSSYISFLTFFTAIQLSVKRMTNAYYVPSETVSLATRKINTQLIDELFVFLSITCRLVRTGFKCSVQLFCFYSKQKNHNMDFFSIQFCQAYPFVCQKT